MSDEAQRPVWRDPRAWGGFLAGFGLASFTAATLVEYELLTPRSQGLAGMAGALCVLGCVVTATLERRRRSR